MFSKALFFCCFLLLLISPADSFAQRSSFIVMGTGDITGVYYPAGGAVCRLLNKSRNEHGIRCAVESTQGSTYNLAALRRGELDLAIAQSDWYYHAAHGSSIFAGKGPDEELRSLINLHNEELIIVARADSGIKKFEDLKGKKVNLGNPQSGQRRTMDLILSKLGWSYSYFELATELPASDMSEALCSGRIDAFVYIVGHPNASIAEATTFCDSRIIPLPEPLMQRLVKEYPFYRMGQIEGAMYRGNPYPVPTIQLNASMVTNVHLSQETAYHLTKTLYENFETFKKMHPALRTLSRDEAFNPQYFINPAHSGVLQYLNQRPR